jgi:hypothetical protein
MRFPKSKIGWIFVVIYLALSSWLVYQAFTCTDWMCDMVEIPAAIPFGAVYFGLLRLLNPIFLFGSISYAPFRNWYFIIPTLIGNSILYYWFGVGVRKLYLRLFRKAPA